MCAQDHQPSMMVALEQFDPSRRAGVDPLRLLHHDQTGESIMLKDGFPSLNVEFIDDATLQAAEYSVRARFVAEPCAQLGARDVRRVDVGAERTEDAQRQLGRERVCVSLQNDR